MVLVAGATGLVGNEICRRISGRGERVRALVRATSSTERIELLRSCGAEIRIGDLRDSASVNALCEGVDAVISTASSTISRQAGDSIESVDSAGQMNLVTAAKAAGVKRFIFLSFRKSPGLSFPLDDAKREVEKAIASMNFTIIQASWFTEVWLSPGLGFDYANRTARIYGPGTSPVSWVSYQDVAEICTLVLRNPAAGRRTIEFGGPAAISPLEVVACFEKIGGRPFNLDYIPETTLRSQFEQATDSMQKSFAALILGLVRGDAINMASIVDQFGIKLRSVEEYARSVLGKIAAA